MLYYAVVQTELVEKRTSLWSGESTDTSLFQKVPGGGCVPEATLLGITKRRRGLWRKRLQYPQIRRRKIEWGYRTEKKGTDVAH